MRSNKDGQVTIFIIMAIVIVAGIIFYFSTDFTFARSVPAEMRPVYDYYLSCLENEVMVAARVMGEQAGYLEVPEFVRGSPFAPGSSQLNFFGQSVPYWMYLSGNNILREQVPTIEDMQIELDDYLEERLASCDFEQFEEAGYYVYIEEGGVTSTINEEDIQIVADNKFTIFKDDTSVIVDSHKLRVKSKLGKFYNYATSVLDKEKREAFLESYAIDVLRLYAPVDGVEFGCAPKVFVDEQIRSDLYDGLEANMNSIKLEGGYYRLTDEERSYFVEDIGVSIQESASVMYNRNWPTKIEIYGDRVVSPVGIQEGLQALGFCYVPYHLVYDVNFPVMIQFYDNDNFFQFPVSVVIDNNKPRESMDSNTLSLEESRVCENPNSDIQIYTYDLQLNPVEATVSLRCLDSVCDVGSTSVEGDSSVFRGYVPACVNAEITAIAEGYSLGKDVVSTNSDGIANILLKKKYDVQIVGEEFSDKTAVINFNGEDYSATMIYPDMRSVELVEDYYEVTTYVYEDSVLKFPATRDRLCVDAPREGLAGFVGAEEERCYDIDIPEMEIDMVIIGGGVGVEYLTESMLKGGKLDLNVEMFGEPASIEELSENYAKIESSSLYIDFQ